MISHAVRVEAEYAGDYLWLHLSDLTTNQALGSISIPATSVGLLLYPGKRVTGALNLASPPFVEVKR